MSNQITTRGTYFDDIAPIWAAYFAGRIGTAKRDAALAPYRAFLRNLRNPPTVETGRLLKRGTVETGRIR